MSDAALFIAASVVAWALVLGIRRWAVSLRLLDVPTDRSMHSKVTPRGGGAAIVAVTWLGIGVAIALGKRPEWTVLAGYLAGSIVIVGVSLADDVFTLPSGIRLAAHFTGGAVTVAGLVVGSRWFPGGGLAWIVLPAAVLWAAGLINAYNFMDGIDGLAAVQGVVAGLGWAALGYIGHLPWLALLGLLVAGGCVGFLVHNWPPAKIFMGDVGSAFLGFTFAFITLAALSQSAQVAVVGVLLLWPFIFDTSFTLVRRLMRGENVLVAHRSHLYQRLVLAGWSQPSVTFLYVLLTLAAFALGVLWLATSSSAAALLVASLVVPLSIGLWIVVVRSEHRVSVK